MIKVGTDIACHGANMSKYRFQLPNLSKKGKIAILLLLIIGILAISPGIYLAVKVGSDGAWDPASVHQRYRADEYSADKPFFQWWYFSLKDYSTGMTFAFCYSLSRPAVNQSNRGCYVMAALVNDTSRFHLYYKYPLDSLVVANRFDLSIDNQVLDEIDSGHYRVRGHMDNASRTWMSEGISNSSTVEWDLDVYRVAGWYGQHDMEDLIKLCGVISWNTFAYDSEVNGSVWINSTRYDIDRSPRFRIYCDMNWGETFPHGDPAIDHMWGWFYTGKPDATPSSDFCKGSKHRDCEMRLYSAIRKNWSKTFA